jgi:Fe-S cluster biogenesis protein NfuA
MFVPTQSTPNPASLMFIPGEAVLPPGAGGVTFSSARDARAGSPSSPLASAIFRVEGVAAVFFGSDFITVTKKEESSWELVKPGVFEAVMEHYASGRPVLGEGAPSSAAASASAEPHRAPDTAPHEDDSETVAMIKELIETRVRPAVQEDGGDIEFVSFDESDGAVVVRMRGACSGCPSSAVTLKSGIENMLMHYVPEVTSVEEAEPDEAQSEGARAFSALEKHLST